MLSFANQLDMQHPYQCLKEFQRGGKSHIIAACGARLFVLNRESPSVRAEWEANEKVITIWRSYNQRNKFLAALYCNPIVPL